MTQVFIVDDHPIMREAVRDVITAAAEMTVCGEAATATEALQNVSDSRADIVLIDLSLPDKSGIELARDLRAESPKLLTAILSGHGESMHVRQALAAGMQGYILKGNGREISQAVRTIMEGGQYLSPDLEE